MKVTPKSVSQRVVKTVSLSPLVAVKSTSVPSDLPIQLRCWIFTRSM
jgi:hypothetical protein